MTVAGREVWFITHPDVAIDPAVPVPEWRLSARGLARMETLLSQAWVREIGVIWSSTERKATDAAAVLARGLGVGFATLAALGENDRSATGYLPRAAFDAMADAFFGSPHESVRGWERAVDAQARIVAAVEEVIARSPGDGAIAILSHGAVGALYLCHLQGVPISRAADQPAGSGGNFYAFTQGRLKHGWRTIDG